MPRRVTRAGITENMFSICFTIGQAGRKSKRPSYICEKTV